LKQKTKRVLAGVLAVLTAFSTLFSSGTTAFAASPSANISFWTASVRESGEVSELKPGYNHGHILYSRIDGNIGYCMNFGLAAKGGQLMNSYDNPNTNLSYAQELLLNYCLYFGHGSNGSGTPSSDEFDQYIATQAMVWVIVANIYGTPSGDSAALKLCNTAPNPTNSYNYYAAIKSKINASYNATVPSFASGRMSIAPTHELKWNESNKRFEITLNDANGVLGNFDLSLGGYSINRNGNSVTISCENVNTNDTMATMNSIVGAVETTTSCVFWLTGRPGDQEFVSERPQADPVHAYFKVKTENIGYGEMTKTDDSSGVKLAGAVYGIYSDSPCKNLVGKMTTNTDGYAKSKALVVGTYYVKEITAPKGYVLNGKVHTLVVRAGQTTGFAATDIEQLGAITIYKEGEVLLGWNGKGFTYETKKLPGATFKVTAGADIYKADGTKVYSNGDVMAENLVSGSDGKVILTDLHLGTYIVTETKSIDGFTINTTPITVIISYKDQNVDVQYEATTVKNSRQKAEVFVIKKDSVTENPLDGGKYTLYADNDIKNYAGQVIVTKGTALETISTKEDGSASYTLDLPILNGYYVMETQAPNAYVRNSNDKYSFYFNYLPETTAKAMFTHTFKNDRTTARIQISKVDSETQKAVPQGDASLKGAVYGLYARNDIYHPDGATGVLFKAGDIVATLTTDDNENAKVDNLYLGNYYIKEITPSEGYLLDENEYDLVCDYEGDLVTEVSRSAISKEQVIKQPFQLIKVSDNGEDTEAPVLSGAGFEVYLKSSLSVKKDGSFDFDSASPIVIGNNKETILFTDDKGYLMTCPIPYGTYVVIEKVTPHNMKTIKPFEVKVVENNPTQPQTWRVFIDREFKAKLRIVKKDADTKMTVLIPNTEFKIFNMDTNKYVEMITTYPSKVVHKSFFTDGDGDLILPAALKIGNYRVEEVKAPFGYVVNKNYVEVIIDTNTFYEVDSDTNEAIITVDYADEPVFGELIIEKKGEVLDDFKGGFFAKSYEKKFSYKECVLSGAQFEVYAAEDIYTADMQLDEKENRTKYYSKGDLVATVETDEDGKATVSKLPLGKYKVVEKKSPYGHILNDKEQFVTFVYVDDKTPVIKEGLSFVNERQKVQITVVKKDGETKSALEGAVFGLYVKEDILDVYGKEVVKEDTLIEKAISGKDGKTVFVLDLPLGKYYVKELEAPKGYIKSDEVFDVDASYEEGKNILNFESEFENHPIRIKITKTDITGEHELEGATMSVIDKDGKVVDTWISGLKPHVIQGIAVGKYILREEIAPYGYKIANDVEFEVKETKEIQQVTMKDELVKGKILIEKTDEFTKKGIEGVEFEIRDENNKIVETLVTDKKGKAESKELDIALFKDGKFEKDLKYYVVETKAAKGYILDKTVHELVLKYDGKTPEVVKYTLSITNKPSEPRLPQTGDNFNPWLFVGIGLGAIVLGIISFFWKKEEETDL